MLDPCFIYNNTFHLGAVAKKWKCRLISKSFVIIVGLFFYCWTWFVWVLKPPMSPSTMICNLFTFDLCPLCGDLDLYVFGRSWPCHYSIIIYTVVAFEVFWFSLKNLSISRIEFLKLNQIKCVVWMPVLLEFPINCSSL